jgi:outer membrane protein insertion porin family
MGVALAQEAVKVAGISFEGNRRYSTENLRHSMRTREGDVLDRDRLNKDIAMLRAYFEEISYREEQVPGGVRLVFRVVENPLVSRVEFLGVEALLEEELRALIDTRTGYPLASFRLENDVARIVRRYKDEGYHWIEVKSQVLDDEGARRVLFRVVEGPYVSVDDVVFEGLSSVPERKVRGEMALRPAATFLTSTPYVERRLEEDRVAVARFLRDQGFLDAKAWIRDTTFDADRNEATIHVLVEEGGLWTLGEVQVTGGEGLVDRDRVVAKAGRLKPGQRWIRRDLDRAVDEMEAEAKRQGYSECRVEVEAVPRAEGRVQDVRLVVEEGKRFHIRFLDVSGNVLTRDKVILREFTVAPGDPLDSAAVAKSVRRVLDTQYFLSAVPVFKDTDDPGMKDVEIRVEENPRTSKLRMGVGVTSDRGVIGSFSVSFRNFDISDVPARVGDFFDGRGFKGGGQTLTILLEPGTRVSNYRLQFMEPWFFDRRLGVGFDLYKQESTIFAYDDDRSGLAVQVQKSWLLAGEDLDDLYVATLIPRVESVRIAHLDDKAPPNAYALEGRNSSRTATLDLLWRRTDQEHATERGWRISASSEYGGGSLGGDFDFWKNQAEFVRVFTLWRDADERAHTLKLRAGGGTAMATGDGPVPLTERFLVGGGTGIGAVRGYAYGGLGPHGFGDPRVDPVAVRRSIANNEGEPMGGEAFAVGSVEYGFPVLTDVIGGAVFLDAGNNAFGTGRLKRDWRASWGWGILIRIPFFGQIPLRFDFGYPFKKVRGDDRQLLSFEFSTFF